MAPFLSDETTNVSGTVAPTTPTVLSGISFNGIPTSVLIIGPSISGDHYNGPPLPDAAKELLGKYIPRNSSKYPATCLPSFSEFVVRYILNPDQLQHVYSAYFDPVRHHSVMGQVLPLAQMYVFGNDNGSPIVEDHTDWAIPQMEGTNKLLVEYVANARKVDGSEFSPATLRNYISGIARVFDNEWGYKISHLTGPVFVLAQSGIYILNNKIRMLQASEIAPQT